MVLVFSSAAPRRVSTSTGKKSVSHKQQAFFAQTNLRRLWRSRRSKSRSVAEGGAGFQQPFPLPVSAQSLAGIAFFVARRSGKNLLRGSRRGVWIKGAVNLPVFGIPTQWAKRDTLKLRGENCRETIFVSQLSRSYPRRGGNFERGKNALSCGRETVLEAF